MVVFNTSKYYELSLKYYELSLKYYELSLPVLESRYLERFYVYSQWVLSVYRQKSGYKKILENKPRSQYNIMTIIIYGDRHRDFFDR